MNYNIRLENIKKKLTPEFLETLKEFGKVVGWETDYCEISAFICLAYEKAEQPEPSQEKLEPYDTED